MEKGNGNTVLLTVIGVATLLVALVGATFAYFTAAVSNNQAQSISVTTATPVGLVYVGTELVLDNAIPGQSAEEKTFTVTNPGASSDMPSTTAQEYDLDIIIDSNGFTYTTTEAAIAAGKSTTPQLVVTVTAASTTAGDNAKSNTPVLKIDDDDTDGVVTVTDNTYVADFTDGTTKAKATSSFGLVASQRIEIGEVQTYTINLDFEELDIAQDNNQTKSFNAHIEISNPVSVQ